MIPVKYNLQSAALKKQKTTTPEIMEEAPDMKYLDNILDKLDENDQNDIKRKFKRQATRALTTMSFFKGTPRQKDTRIISEYSLFYKNDYIRTLLLYE